MKVEKENYVVGILKALQSVGITNKDSSRKFRPMEGLIQLRKFLTYKQNKQNNAKFKDYAKNRSEGMKNTLISFHVG